MMVDQLEAAIVPDTTLKYMIAQRSLTFRAIVLLR